MRVFELAKRVGVSSKALVAELREFGANVRNHMSIVEDIHSDKILANYLGGAKRAEQPVVKKGRKLVLIKKDRPAPVVKEPAVQEASQAEEHAMEKENKGVAAVAVEEVAPGEEVVTQKAAKQDNAVVDEKPVATQLAGEKPEESLTAVTDESSLEPAVQKAEAPVEPVEQQRVISGEPSPEVQKKPARVEGGVRDAVKKIRAKKEKEESEAKGKDLPQHGKSKKAKRSAVKSMDFVDYSKGKGGRKWTSKKDARRGGKQGGAQLQRELIHRKKAIKFQEGCTVKEFSEKIGRKSAEVIKMLFMQGSVITINQPLDRDTALVLAGEFGVNLEVVEEKSLEENFMNIEDNPDNMVQRPPIVTVMGHVDHGKTSLLDTIRNEEVTAGEAGGITQHMGAYTVSHSGKSITFLDTPGHEAFTAMRSRGASITDIILLVVAADDGVMPQTIEAMNHAKAADVPVIVVINKIDKPNKNIQRVMTELSEHDLSPEAWGGNTLYCEVSAKAKLGIENLLDTILLQTEMSELEADADRTANGTIVEARLDKAIGPVATLLVQGGTLNVGDCFVVGGYDGKVRILSNDKGCRVDSAGPSVPVEVTGLSGVPSPGDQLVVVKDEKTARLIAESRLNKDRAQAATPRVTLDDLFKQIEEGKLKELNLVIKGDVHGSVEATKDSLLKLDSEKVSVKVIHDGVGRITETDVTLASASNAIIIGFNVSMEPKAAALADVDKVDVRFYDIIYKVVEDIVKAMEGLLEPTYEENITGKAEVRNIFTASRVGVIAGCVISEGKVSKECDGVRVYRENAKIYEGKLGSLKRFKDDVKEVSTGYECGIVIENYKEIEVGDVLEFYELVEVRSSL